MLCPTEKSNYKIRYGIYKCECGAMIKAVTKNVKKKITKTCISCRYEKSKIHALSKHKLYMTWFNMVDRCNNVNNKNYKDYGERGITVCKRWLKIENFIEDMYPSYQEGLSIDRENTNGNYEPNNCRWTTKTIQTRNTRLIYCSNTSGYRGVSWHTRDKIWSSTIRVNKKAIYLGSFINKIDAAKAYDQYVIKNNLEHTINGVL